MDTSLVTETGLYMAIFFLGEVCAQMIDHQRRCTIPSLTAASNRMHQNLSAEVR